MPEQRNYWQRAVGRRTAMRLAAAGGGLAALTLAGCGGGSNNSKSSAGNTGNQTTSTSAAAAASPAASTARATPAALDSTKGKPGGTFTFQGAGSAGTNVLVNTNDDGFTHSGLLAFKNGRPIVDPLDISSEPDLATAMPEQVDPLTYRFTLRNAKFHNGTPVTSSDVKYSFQRYATSDMSPVKSQWTWLDSVTTPDAQTAIVKTKAPFADAVAAMAARGDAFIMSQAWEESADGPTKLMGAGPFMLVDIQQPIQMRFKRNPDFYLQPYPYFDQLTVLTMTDPTKKIADFVTRQIQMTYYFPEEERDQVKQGRPDALLWSHQAPANDVLMRTDQPPFNDKRVRQALALSIDRKSIRDNVSKGEGEEDQVFSIASSKVWGFRKPAELGTNYQYWKYDPQTAKQLLSAAGVNLPIEANMSHWDATVNRPFADSATLLIANWHQLGIANLKDLPVLFGPYATTVGVGNYQGMTLNANATPINPAIGGYMKGELWSPPEGVKPPTKNQSYINDPQLSALADKQLMQLNLDERKQTFHQMEDIMAEQQYRISLSTFSYNFFADPSLKNIQIPRDAYGGGIGYVKYWWFG